MSSWNSDSIFFIFNTSFDDKGDQGVTEGDAEACSLQASQCDRPSNDGIRSHRNWYNSIISLSFTLLIFISNGSYGNEWNWSPRLESWTSQRKNNQRFLLKNQMNLEGNQSRIFLESFFEKTTNEYYAQELRSPSSGYLQEAYYEYRSGEFFLKVGKQALRWSETWSLPSLDVFTGRRYNRGFLDPMTEQFSHSTGLLLSHTGPRLSLDAYSLWLGPETTYPEPLTPQDRIQRGAMEGGLRGKVDLNGHQMSAMIAHLESSFVYGGTWSYAFETVVPKIELGKRTWYHSNDRTFQPKVIDFGTLGFDLFFDRWLFTPQISLIQDDLTKGPSKNYFSSVSWIGNRHEFLFQGLLNEPYVGQFAHFAYTYKANSWCLFNFFWQNYDGINNSIYGSLRDTLGSSVIGGRMQFDWDILGE